MSTFSRPNTRTHRDVWATLDNDKRSEVRTLAEQIAADRPDTPPNDVWAEALAGAATATPQASTRAANRIGRLQAAEAEAAALKAWTEGGEQGDRPDTTNLDSLKAGEQVKATKAAKTAEPAPDVPEGSLAVTLRGKTQPSLVRSLTGATVDDYDRLVFTADEAQAIVDKLRSNTTGASQYTTRCLEGAITLVRHAAPAATDADGGATARAVDALIAAGVSWAPVIKNDGSTHFSVDNAEPVSTRKILAEYKPTAPAE